ncbi:hypothetical protein MPH_11311 [Macrophomina phaseolina MS6]|uniref:Uncharacterized protein n=2 Tax=Macrophomina phaseolina TaxID=35725 RepID=K2S4Z0_MACPH|nr:hypothetical protein MPH_11311 [Macrophomina phaseolina MS6]KAH7057069.1 hypothetical protein B0J12DRAFT_402951 [Macrophomina phaseolina]
MGICASCLGLGRKPQHDERSEASHLLGPDQYQHQYGAVAAQGPHMGMSAPQPDPEEIRRQRDALERICAQTSDKLIDVSQSAHPDEGHKMHSEYHRLFMERFPAVAPPEDSRPSSSGTAVDNEEAAWLADITKSQGEEGDWDHVKVIDNGSLTIQFDEVLGLDRRSAPSPVGRQ